MSTFWPWSFWDWPRVSLDRIVRSLMTQPTPSRSPCPRLGSAFLRSARARPLEVRRPKAASDAPERHFRVSRPRPHQRGTHRHAAACLLCADTRITLANSRSGTEAEFTFHHRRSITIYQASGISGGSFRRLIVERRRHTLLFERKSAIPPTAGPRPQHNPTRHVDAPLSQLKGAKGACRDHDLLRYQRRRRAPFTLVRHDCTF